MFDIILNDMTFMACHGVLEEEKVTPQKFVVDVKIETDQVVTAAQTDRIEDALNYVDVYQFIRHLMMEQHFDLIETIAMKIATGLVEKHSNIISVDTKVTKVNPPIEGFTGTVSCVYTAFGSE